jgi:tRNA dimethylallyltransferase
MQVYRGLDLLTQAPPARVRRRVPHHLVGRLDPSREFDAARFAREARALIARIRRKGRVPFVVGGTGLYAMALLDGIFPGPGRSPGLRAALERAARRSGTAALHARLVRRDPEAARRIHPNDLRRIVRALEVIRATRRRFTDLKAERKGIWDPERARLFGLALERGELYDRINRRVDRMFEDGLVREARRALGRKLSRTAGGCLGLKEIGAHLEGKLGLEEARELLRRNTRRLAKRQIAWFKRDPRIRWVAAGARTPAEIAREIEAALRADFPDLPHRTGSGPADGKGAPRHR